MLCKDFPSVVTDQHTGSKCRPTFSCDILNACRAFSQVRELRERTAVLPDDYWVVLVGDMITEEALPTYMAMLNTLDGVRDETGAAQVSLTYDKIFHDGD